MKAASASELNLFEPSEVIFISQDAQSDPYFFKAEESEQQRVETAAQLTQIQANEASLQKQIADLKRLRAAGASPAKAISQEKQLYALQKSLNDNKAYEQRDVAAIKSLDQWINYYETLDQSSVDWNARQDRLAIRDQRHQARAEDLTRRNQEQTADGHAYFRALNAPPPAASGSGGGLINAVDGWGTISWPQ